MNIRTIIRIFVAVVCTVGLCEPSHAATDARLCHRQTIDKGTIAFQIPCGFQVSSEKISLGVSNTNIGTVVSNADGTILLAFDVIRREDKHLNAEEAMHGIRMLAAKNPTKIKIGREVIARFDGKYGLANTVSGKSNAGSFSGKQIYVRIVIIDRSKSDLFVAIVGMTKEQQQRGGEAIFWDVMRSVRFNVK